ncbi:MAG: hypothetical protein ACRELU_02365 [Gemmatimonadota bacterium]
MIRVRWADFEDALQTASALQVGADVLVTRNTEDYKKAPVSIEVPEQFLARLTALQEDGRDETAPPS